MDDRCHRAAQDGRTEILKKAYKEELNKPDDNGMTPTLWAAYSGNFEALTVCCKRGGDVNKCDYTGNSALHLAAQKGHFNCVSFLVNFGANLWQLDNDYNTALMLAGRRGHGQCVDFLDNAVLEAKSSNPKKVREKEEKAKKKAEKRIKEYEKLQLKQQRKMDEIHSASRRISVKGDAPDGRRTSVTANAPYSKISTVNRPLFQARPGKTTPFTISKRQPGEMETRPIEGVASQQFDGVLYRQSEEMNGDDRPTPGRRDVRGVFSEENPERKRDPTQGAFGTKAFRNHFTVNSLYSLLKTTNASDVNYGDAIVPPTSKPAFGIPQNRDANYSDDENSEEEEEVDALVAFLESLNMMSYLPLFQEQKIDMETLAMCSSSDLTEIGLVMGPKKKILDALKSRKENEEDLNSEMTTF